MTTHADHPTDTANELLTAARTCLAEGDLMQASENGWGAAEQMVKAVAEKRGWDHDTRADLYRAVGGLADLSAGAELRPLFLAANALDQNSYEDDMPAATVAVGLDEVEEFTAALAPYLP